MQNPPAARWWRIIDSIFTKAKVAREESCGLRNEARALRLALREQRTLLRLAGAKAAMDRAEAIAQRENWLPYRERTATRDPGGAA